MPVFPNGIPTYTIHPPLTSGELGKPINLILHDTHHVFDLMEDK